MERAEGPFAPIQVQGPITSPKPFYKSKAPLQVQSPQGGCLNWKGPKAPSPQYKSKAPVLVQSPTTSPSPQRRLFKFEGAEGPFVPMQVQGPSTTPKPLYKSKAPLQVQNP